MDMDKIKTEKWLLPANAQFIERIIERYKLEHDEKIGFILSARAIAQIILDSNSKSVTIIRKNLWIRWDEKNLLSTTKTENENYIIHFLEYQGNEIVWRVSDNKVKKAILIDVNEEPIFSNENSS